MSPLRKSRAPNLFFCRSRRKRNDGAPSFIPSGPSGFAIQDHFTQPVYLPGQIYPQSLPFGNLPPLPIGYQHQGATPNDAITQDTTNPANMSSYPAVPQYHLSPAGLNKDPLYHNGIRAAPLMAQRVRHGAVDWPPVSQVDVVGAVQCEELLCGKPAHCAIDSGSVISLMTRHFIIQNKLTTVKWNGPAECVADESPLNITGACQAEVTVLGLKLEGICGVMDLYFDALLVVDFLQRNPFVLDFGNKFLCNPSTNMAVPLWLLVRYLSCDSSNVIYPDETSFAENLKSRTPGQHLLHGNLHLNGDGRDYIERNSQLETGYRTEEQFAIRNPLCAR